MNCAEIDRLLPAFADGEFEGSEQTEFEIHLAHCGTCRERVAAQQVFRSILREKASMAVAPERLRARVRHDISRARLVSQAQRYAVYTAVAASVAGVASATYVMGMPPALGVEDHVRISQQVRDLPVDFDPAVGDPAAWTREHVSFNPTVPVFRSSEVPLRGVRILPVRDRDGAVFVYGREPRRRSTILVVPDPAMRMDGRPVRLGEREVRLANHQGYNVAMWRNGGLMYSLVSDLGEAEVMQLLRELEAR